MGAAVVGGEAVEIEAAAGDVVVGVDVVVGARDVGAEPVMERVIAEWAVGGFVT
jgi:hypothetical protein